MTTAGGDVADDGSNCSISTIWTCKDKRRQKFAQVIIDLVSAGFSNFTWKIVRSL